MSHEIALRGGDISAQVYVEVQNNLQADGRDLPEACLHGYFGLFWYMSGEMEG